jgi:hypothetical protein
MLTPDLLYLEQMFHPAEVGEVGFQARPRERDLTAILVRLNLDGSPSSFLA